MDNQITKSDMWPQLLGFYTQSTKSWNLVHIVPNQSTTTSQIYLNTNVVHYLNMKIVCMTSMCKQHE
jgi:hypothetical protein